jgi:hypothetical protein
MKEELAKLKSDPRPHKVRALDNPRIAFLHAHTFLSPFRLTGEVQARRCHLGQEPKEPKERQVMRSLY